PDDRSKLPPPLPPSLPYAPPTLSYRPPYPSSRASVHPIFQFLLGMASWALGLGLLYLYAFWRFNNGNVSLFLLLALAILAGALVLAIFLRNRYSWFAFLPGVLLAFALSCLIPVGVLLAVCSGYAH